MPSKLRSKRSWILVHLFVLGVVAVLSILAASTIGYSTAEAAPAPVPTCTPATKGIGAWLKNKAPCAQIGLARTATFGGRGDSEGEISPPISGCDKIIFEEGYQAWLIRPDTDYLFLNDPHRANDMSRDTFWVEYCGNPEDNLARYSITPPNGKTTDMVDYIFADDPATEYPEGKWRYYSLWDEVSTGVYTITIQTDSSVFTRAMTVVDYMEYIKPPHLTIAGSSERREPYKPGDRLTIQYHNFGGINESISPEDETTVIAGLYEQERLVGEWSFTTSDRLYEQDFVVPEDVPTGNYLVKAQIVKMGEVSIYEPGIHYFIRKPFVFAEDYYTTFNVNNDLRKLTPAEAKASSSLQDAAGKYSASNAIDNDTSTAWVEGVLIGPGVGQWIKVDFEQPVVLKQIKVDIGYDHTAVLFLANNRVKRAAFFFSDGTSFEYTFLDQRGLQTILVAEKMGEDITTDSVKMEVLEVYRGNRFDDTAISEMEFWGTEQ